MATQPVVSASWVRLALLILAVVAFLLATFGAPAPINLVDLGLAFGFGAFLVP